MKQTEHRGHSILWSIEQPSGTNFCNARGHVEFYQGETFCTVNLTGAVNKFTSEEDAERDLLTKAKSWIDRRTHSTVQETSSMKSLTS
jgi:hypothetical protein